MANIRLVVLAPDLLARVGLAQLLDEREGCCVVGRIASGEDMADDAFAFQP
jgi:hypothetical protein